MATTVDLSHKAVAAVLTALAWTGPSSAQSPTPIGTGVAAERRINTEFGIRTTLLWSDNVDLLPEASAVSGALIEIVPYVLVVFSSPRTVGNLYYGLRGQWRDGGVLDNGAAKHDLRAAGDVQLADNWLRLAARANAYDVNQPPFAATSIDPGAQTRNTTFYRDFEVSPYAQGRLGSDMRYGLRYRFRHIEPGSDLLSSNAQNIDADLQRRVGSQFEIAARSSFYRVHFENDFSYDGASSDVLGWWYASRQLRLGAGGNYTRNSILVARDGDNSGFGPSLGIDWFPHTRTSFAARYAYTYFGSVAMARATHRAAAWVFGLNYMRDLAQGADLSSLYLNPNQLFSPPATGSTADTTGLNSAPRTLPGPRAGYNPVDGSLTDRAQFSAAGSQLAGGLLQSPLIFNQSLMASIGWIGQRSSVLGTSWFINRRTAVATPFAPVGEDIDQYGAGLRYAYRLDPRNTLGLTGNYSIAESKVNADRSNLATVAADVATRVSAKTTASLALRHSRQRGDGAVARFDENALIAYVDYRF